MPGLQARFPVGSVQEATTHWCFPLSLLSPLSKNKIFKKKKKEKKSMAHRPAILGSPGSLLERDSPALPQTCESEYAFSQDPWVICVLKVWEALAQKTLQSISSLLQPYLGWGVFCLISPLEYRSPPLSTGMHSKTSGGCLEPWIIPNPVYTKFFPVHTCDDVLIYKLGTVRNEQ